MAYKYTFETGNGPIGPLAGFLFVQGWSTDQNSLPVLADEGFLALAIHGRSGDRNNADQLAQRTNDRRNIQGPGTLRSLDANNAQVGSATFPALSYIRGSYGEFANEHGPGVMVFRCSGVDLAAWEEVMAGNWCGDEDYCGDDHLNLKHTFSIHGNPVPIYSPRVFEEAGRITAVAVTRAMLDGSIRGLVEDRDNAPTNWTLPTIEGNVDFAPSGNTDGGYYLAAQGCFKSVGWWQFPGIGKIIGDAGGLEDAIADLAYELAGTAGKYRRDLEGSDIHDTTTVVPADDPAVEVLYIPQR